MTDASTGARDGDREGTGPVGPVGPAEPTEAPGIEEPRLHADAPAGLAPPPGLAPSPGIRPPEITPPPGFALAPPPGFGSGGLPAPAADATPGVDGEHGFASALDAPVAHAQAASAEQLEAQAQTPEQREAQVQDPSQVQAHAPTSLPSLPPVTGRPAAAARPGAALQAKAAGLSRGAIIGIVAGAVVAIVLVVAIFGMLASSGASTSADPAAPEDTAAGAVEGFLTALAEGDAETAARLAGADPDDPVLSEEVLDRSLELAPISGIEVEDLDEEGAYRHMVRASFEIGAHSASRSFTVWHTREGWDIDDALVALPLFELEGLGLEVNGAATLDGYPSVFPGAYEIGVENDAFEVVAQDAPIGVVAVVSRDDVDPLFSVDARLTEESTETFRSLVRASLEECLAMTGLSTPCGLDVSDPLADGAIPIDGTAQRSLTEEGELALDELSPSPDHERPGKMISYDYITVHTRIEADRGGETVSGTLYSSGELLRPSVDFSEEEPTVSWE